MNFLAYLAGTDVEVRRSNAYPFRRVDFALPYLAVCVLLAAGEALGFSASPASALWPLALFVLILWVLIGYALEVPYWSYWGALLLGFVLALYSESRRARVFDQCDYTSSPLASEFAVEGRAKVTKRYFSFDSTVDGVEVRVMVRRPFAEGGGECTRPDRPVIVPAVGEVWDCAGWLERKPRGERRRRTLWVCGHGSRSERVSESAPTSLGARLRRLREALSSNVGYGLSHDQLAADLDRAIILGERTALPEDVKRMFVDAGTMHVFAISGLHVGVVAWMLVYVLMSAFCFPLRWVAVPLTPILCGYVLMIGAPPSAVRAAVMSVVYFAAPMFFRRSDSLVSWAVTFVVFHLLDPATLLSVGSMMSFTVMLGILLYIRWAKAFGSETLVSWGVSGAAWLSGVAIAARVFERITFGGLLANLVVIPLASLTVVLGFLGSVAGFVCPWLASHLNNFAALSIKAMTGVSWAAARIPYANFVVDPWPLWMCVAWYAAVVMIFWLVRSVYLHHRQII